MVRTTCEIEFSKFNSRARAFFAQRLWVWSHAVKLVELAIVSVGEQVDFWSNPKCGTRPPEDLPPELVAPRIGVPGQKVCPDVVNSRYMLCLIEDTPTGEEGLLPGELLH